VKAADLVSLRIARRCLCAALLGLAAPLAAHPAGDHLPPSSGPVTLLAPDRIKDTKFLPDPKNNPLILAYEEILSKLEEKHIPVTVHALAAYDEGFLIHSDASPATVRYILKYKLLGEQIAWTESGTAEDPAFTLTIPDNGSFLITFPAKDWLVFAANRPPAPVDDAPASKTGDTTVEKPSAPAVSAAALLKAAPDDAVMAYVWPEPGATAEYPLLGELKSITFFVTRDAKEKRPVRAQIVMPAKTPEAALKLKKACQDKFDEVYENAAKLGKIPDELVNAFTVVRQDDEVTIHINLPDDMAEYMFTQFAAALQEEIRLFAVPDKLK